MPLAKLLTTTTTAHRTQLTTKLPTTVPRELLYPAHPTHLATDLVATTQQYSPAPPCAAPALRVSSAPALRVHSAPALRVDSPSPSNLPSIFNNTPTPQPQPLLVVTRQRRQRRPSRRTVDYSSRASTLLLAGRIAKRCHTQPPSTPPHSRRTVD